MLQDLTIKITGVYKANRRAYTAINKNRRNHALSIRLHSENTRLIFQNKAHTVKTGDVTYFPAGADYKIEAPHSEELIVIHFEGYGNSGGEIEIFTPQNPSYLVSFFEDMFKFWHKRELGYWAKCGSIFFSILFELERQNERYKSVSAAAAVQNIIEYLHDNFSNPELSVRILAQKAGVSETYFRKRFAEYLGCNPLEYIRNLRIEYAANLLQTRRYTISEVAEKSGFFCPKYFSTTFKKLKGVSPFRFSG